jgi:hypothetical protein
MLSEAKYLSISLGFWRIEILHFVHDDTKAELIVSQYIRAKSSDQSPSLV